MATIREHCCFLHNLKSTNAALREEETHLDLPFLFALGLALMEGENKSPASALGRLQDLAVTGLRTNTRKTSVQVLVLLQFCRAASECASMPTSPSAEAGEGH